MMVFLNKVEEWKVMNTTVGLFGGPSIEHPFHIHINPFQVVEVFAPNKKLPDGRKKYVLKGEVQADDQCVIDLNDPETWKPCKKDTTENRIWRDVFPVPGGREETVTGADNTSKKVVIPGYFKMRSRFVDYPGLYVLHCHILAHEDRGMMMAVEVGPRPGPVVPMRHH